jgi:hypothetical protein
MAVQAYAELQRVEILLEKKHILLHKAILGLRTDEEVRRYMEATLELDRQNEAKREKLGLL